MMTSPARRRKLGVEDRIYRDGTASEFVEGIFEGGRRVSRSRFDNNPGRGKQRRRWRVGNRRESGVGCSVDGRRGLVLAGSGLAGRGRRGGSSRSGGRLAAVVIAPWTVEFPFLGPRPRRH